MSGFGGVECPRYCELWDEVLRALGRGTASFGTRYCELWDEVLLTRFCFEGGFVTRIARVVLKISEISIIM